MTWSEDLYFNLTYIRYAERFFALTAPIYNYYDNPGSAVHLTKVRTALFSYYKGIIRAAWAVRRKQAADFQIPHLLFGGVSAERTFNMAFVLDQLKPNQKYFEAICGIPHPSTEEKAVSDYVCSVAEKLGLNYEQDKFWNVIVRKPASKGYEDAPVVMLEGHMDMVCVKTPESTHDFSHDPIEIYVDDKGDIRAKGHNARRRRRLRRGVHAGRDGGGFPHPPLELVFTVQEENGCNGVDALDAELKSRRMIGLDVMGETVEYTSCVSRFTSDLMKLTKTCETESAKGAALMLTVSGVQPVHSGAMVHLEQFNAIKITARLLNALSENGAAYRLFHHGGRRSGNYAPVETKTVILCDAPDTVKAILNGELEKIDRELQDGKQNLALEIRDAAANEMLSDADTQAIVDLIYLMPSNTVAIGPRARR